MSSQAWLLRNAMSLKLFPVGLLLIALLVSCAGAPTQEMSDARQSVQAAHEAGADRYSSENLKNAEDYLGQAERELELRYFKRARHGAIVARSEALKAQNVSTAIKAAQAALDAAGDRSKEVLQAAHDLLRRAIDAAARGKHKQAIRLAHEAKLRVQQ